eukprot:TRINITY_DN6432_c0_g1_i1.p1 TRINITY_DN6432_c0_g1~~TRINITY_DN6432_c0_g1_i1.p1  ORF type:complete len:602 (+),score=135.74 TRINITY_DN6432_c0_g1_i1:66-1871(+)
MEFVNEQVKKLLVDFDIMACGMVYAIPAAEIAKDAPAILSTIKAIISEPDYPVSDTQKTCVESGITVLYVMSNQLEAIRSKNFEAILALLDAILGHDLSCTSHMDRKPRSEIASNCWNMIHQDLSKPKVLKMAAGTIIRYMGCKDSSLESMAASYLSMSIKGNPKLFSEHAGMLLDRAINGDLALRSQLLGILNDIYPFNPSAIDSRINDVIELFENIEGRMQPMVLMLIQSMAKKNPKAILPHAKVFIDYIPSQNVSAMALGVMCEVAALDASIYKEALDDLKTAMETNPGSRYSAAKIIGLIGKLDEESARECTEILMDRLNDQSDSTMHPSYLVEVKNIATSFRAVVYEKISYFTELRDSTNNESTRMLAQALIDALNERSLETVSTKVEVQEKKVEEVKKDIEETKEKVAEQEKRLQEIELITNDVKKYVDENIAQLKEFVAGIVKKLPVPMNFTTQDAYFKTHKKLQLHFSCAKKTPKCIYSTKTFIAETVQINKWIKVAYCGVLAGKAIWEMDPIGAVEGLMSVFDAANQSYDANFRSFIAEPFLTSTEEDDLINNLRDSGFFDVFSYDAQLGDWCCQICHPPGHHIHHMCFSFS